MNRAIWKFPLGFEPNPFPVVMPVGARILSLRYQGANRPFDPPTIPPAPTLWALVDPSALRETRAFLIVGTGQVFDPTGLEYVGTCAGAGVTWVWHVFEATNRGPRG